VHNKHPCGLDDKKCEFCPETKHPPPPTTTQKCSHLCQGKTCDEWDDLVSQTCADLEAVYKCNCQGCACSSKQVVSKACTGSCGLAAYKGDGFCDDANNNCGCEYDEGDCCGPTVSKKYCKACKCIDPGFKVKHYTGCGKDAYKGDGVCDDHNNNPGCEYDGGDCCAKSLGSAVKTTYCHKCECLDPNPKPKCKNPSYKGDGVCDDVNNNELCEFDGGDCCVKSLGGAVNKKYCTACKCLDPNPKAPTPKCGQPSYKGDGICDDVNNNKGCEFDGGDCCGSQVNVKYCTVCKCLDPSKSS